MMGIFHELEWDLEVRQLQKMVLDRSIYNQIYVRKNFSIQSDFDRGIYFSCRGFYFWDGLSFFAIASNLSSLV